MIPILFNKDEKTFTSLGLGQMDATLVEVERERNGNYTLYAEVPFNSPQAKLLTKEMLIKADAGSRTKWQTFKINRTIKDTNADVIKVYADHISMDTINDAMKPKVVIRQQTAEGALRQWANNLVSGKAYDVQSDITHVGSTEWTIDEVENARQALGGVSGSILDVWGGEYEFDNNTIILHKEMGRTAPTVLEYGRNIVSLEYEELIDGVYTSIYPYATYTPKSEDNKQLPDIMVTLDELIVDSEYVGNYETRRIQIVDFSGEFDSNAENPEIPTQAKLRTLAKAYVKNNGYGIPKISQEIDFVDLSKTLDYQDIQVMEEIELNDRVPVYYPNIDAETNDVKVTTTNWDVLNNRYSKITLSTIGAMNNNSITSKLNTAIKDLKAEQKKINNTVPYLINAQGNRVWHTTPDENMEHKLGDTWFKKNGKYTIIYNWNGSMWEEVLNDETFMTEIEAEVESAISTAESAKALAVSEAEQALADANKYADEQDALITQQVTNSVDTAISTAEDAKQTAETSYSNAVAEAERLAGEQSTAFNKKFEENTTAMSTLSQATKDADAKAQSALSKAGTNANLLSTHQNTLDTIKNTTIPNVNKVATDAMAEAKSALSSAGSAMSEAKSALSSASSAMDEAKKADGKIADYVTKNGLVSGTTVDNKINTATGEISKKITTVEGKIDGIEIGGQNLFAITNTVDGYERSGDINPSTENHRIMSNLVDIGDTKSLIYQIWNPNKITTTNSNRVAFFTEANAYISSLAMPTLNGSTYQMFKIDVPTNARKVRLGAIMGVGTIDPLIKIKFEKGNKPTDWTPAPEDMQSVAGLDNNITAIYTNESSETAKAINKTLSAYTLETNFNSKTQTYLTNNKYQTASQIATTLGAYTKTTSLDGTVASYLKSSTSATAGAISKTLTAYQTTTGLDSSVSSLLSNTNSQTAKGFNSKLIAIEGKIPTYVGGRNLLVARDAKVGYVNVGSVGIVNREHLRTNEYISIEPNTDYSLSGNAYELWRINWFTDNKTYISGTSFDTRGTEKTKTVTSPANAQLATVSYPNGKVKFEQGSVVTDWSPAPEDMLGESEFTIFKNDYKENAEGIGRRLNAIDSSEDGSFATRLNKTESTANGNATTISNIKTKPGEQIVGYQTIKERSDLYERVIGADESGVNANISKIVQASGIVQSEVSNMPFGGRNLIRNSGAPTNLDEWTPKSSYYGDFGLGTHSFWKSKSENLFILSPNSDVEMTTMSNRFYIKPDTEYTFSMIVFGDSNVSSFDVFFLYRVKGETGSYNNYIASTLNTPSGSEATKFVWKFKSPNLASLESAFLRIDHNGRKNTSSASSLYFTNVKLEEGSVATDWTPAVEDTNSKITQLADNINLKVSSDQLISEINLSKEGVRIAGKNIQLDGNVSLTSTFSVPNANIKDLAVDKITGTNAQFTTMITKGLAADVITSTMIKADVALFNMLFSTTLATDRLAARDAWIKSANISTLDASKITSGTIAAARLDAGAIVTAGLTANVVKSTHIEGSTALVNKIFADDAYVKALTAKTAFISSIQAVNLSASKITSGTLDASKVTVSNLDANNITANKTSFVQTAWNAINSQVSIDGSGIKTQNTNGDFSRIISGELRSYNGDSSSTAILGSGRSQYFDKAGSQFILGNTLHGTEWNNDGTLQVTHNRRFAIGRYADYAVNNGLFHPYIALEYPPDKTGDEPMGIVRFYKAVYLQKDIYAGNNAVSGLSKITFHNGGNIESQSSTSNMLIGASNKLVVYASGANAFEIDSGYMYLRRNLSMEGNNITNQSDRRLKTNIVDTPVDSLSAISNWVFKSFDRVNNGSHDDIGLIAQDTSEIVVYDEENDIFNVNSSKQIMMNSHGIQQLNIKVDDEITQLKAQIASLQDELAQIKGA